MLQNSEVFFFYSKLIFLFSYQFPTLPTIPSDYLLIFGHLLVVNNLSVLYSVQLCHLCTLFPLYLEGGSSSFSRCSPVLCEKAEPAVQGQTNLRRRDWEGRFACKRLREKDECTIGVAICYVVLSGTKRDCFFFLSAASLGLTCQM